MKKSRLIHWMIGLLTLPLLVTSCNNMEDHYRIPDWLKGSAFQVLESRGNYSIFLEGVKKAGYESIVDGKSILTVMAPNDSAFTVYLHKKGLNSISEMNDTELKKLIGFHLVYYAFDWNKLVNFRPAEGDGATDEQKAVMAGYYYKFRTKSNDAISKEFNPALNDSVSVYHLERFLPVFSYQLFETKAIDAQYNYEYFYPNSHWTGGSNGFNISNASVQNTSNVISDNGYVYLLNQVLDPLETIYTELKNRYAEYSMFFDLYNSYSSYTLDNELTKNFGNGQDLYLHSHKTLPPIAYEWPTSSYLNIKELSSSCYNVFAPTNAAMELFFNDFWKVGGYSTLADLDPLVLEYFLLQSFSSDKNLVFPEEITNGTVLTSFKTPININPDDVSLRKVCANGSLYGIDRMPAPAIFSSVAGPAFKYLKFIDFLYALDGSDLLLALASNETRFISLMPDTAQFNSEHMRLASFTTGKVLQKFSDETGTFVDMSANEMSNLVNMHLCNGATELSSSETQVLETNVAFNYWYVHNGKITSNLLFNQYLNPAFSGDPFVDFHEINNGSNNWSNGKSYSYNYPGLFKADESDGLEYALAICNDSRYPYYLFSQLLLKAGLITETSLTNLMPGSRFIAFIPSNEAIKAKLSSIPGSTGLTIASNGSLSGTLTQTNKTKLANYLRSLFITSDLNTFTGYPYPGAGIMGTFDTYGNYKLVLSDHGANQPLTVKFTTSTNTVNVVSTYYYLPFAFKDGCFHLLEDIVL
ncbi:MAG TPA: fasciclin domain-containing protein [Bacteroidales bacterium]|nr:fasciclin domain-containing protein [Bacteroidales bacterium]